MKSKSFVTYCLSFFLLGILVFSYTEQLIAQTSAKKNVMAVGRYAEIVCLRMIAISQSLLELEKNTLARLEAKKNVDADKFKARLISARLQLRKLLHLSRTLDKKMDSSDPARARVESLRKRLLYFVTAHRKNIDQIAAKIDLSDLKELSEKLVSQIEKDVKPGQYEKIMLGDLDRAF